MDMTWPDGGVGRTDSCAGYKEGKVVYRFLRPALLQFLSPRRFVLFPGQGGYVTLFVVCFSFFFLLSIFFLEGVGE